MLPAPTPIGTAAVWYWPTSDGHVSTSSTRPEASTTPDYGTAPWTCVVYTINPAKSGDDISGTVEQICNGTGYTPIAVEVVIQKYEALGYWEDLATPDMSSWSSDYVVGLEQTTDCSGDGNQLFRVAGNGYADGGLYMSLSVVSTTPERWTC